MAHGGPEQVPGLLMKPMGGAGQPTSDLDLRFPNDSGASVNLSLRFRMILGPRTLSLDACTAKSPGGEFRATPSIWFFAAFRVWGGNF